MISSGAEYPVGSGGGAVAPDADGEESKNDSNEEHKDTGADSSSSRSEIRRKRNSRANFIREEETNVVQSIGMDSVPLTEAVFDTLKKVREALEEHDPTSTPGPASASAPLGNPGVMAYHQKRRLQQQQNQQNSEKRRSGGSRRHVPSPLAPDSQGEPEHGFFPNGRPDNTRKGGVGSPGFRRVPPGRHDAGASAAHRPQNGSSGISNGGSMSAHSPPRSLNQYGAPLGNSGAGPHRAHSPHSTKHGGTNADHTQSPGLDGGRSKSPQKPHRRRSMDGNWISFSAVDKYDPTIQRSLILSELFFYKMAVMGLTYELAGEEAGLGHVDSASASSSSSSSSSSSNIASNLNTSNSKRNRHSSGGSNGGMVGPIGNAQPLPRWYFGLPATNPFNQFQNMCAALRVVTRGRVTVASTFADPMTVLGELLVKLTAYGITKTYPPVKLRKGWGVEVCEMLNEAADHSMEVNGVHMLMPGQRVDDTQVVDDDEEEANGLVVDHSEDELVDEADDLLFAEAAYDEEYTNGGGSSATTSAAGGTGPTEDRQMIHSSVSRQAWATELERVSARLRDAGRGRSQARQQFGNPTSMAQDRIERASALAKTLGAALSSRTGISSSLSSTAAASSSSTTTSCEVLAQLQWLQKDMKWTVDRIRQMEVTLSRVFKAEAASLVVVFRDIADTKKQLAKMSTRVSQKAEQLEIVRETLRDAKADMERSSSERAGDGSLPLIKVKDAIRQVKRETRQLALRMGMVSQQVYSAQMAHLNQARGARHLRTRNTLVSTVRDDDDESV